MKAFKCDRCGKFYDLKFEQIKSRAEDFCFKIVDDISEIDLCDKCFNEFQEWMTVYSDDKAKSEET